MCMKTTSKTNGKQKYYTNELNGKGLVSIFNNYALLNVNTKYAHIITTAIIINNSLILANNVAMKSSHSPLLFLDKKSTGLS